MHKPYLYIPTAEERRVVRRWTWRVLIIYGAFVLTAFGLLFSASIMARHPKI